MRMILHCCAIMVLVTCTMIAGESPAAGPEPTAEETSALQAINALRADPGTACERIGALINAADQDFKVVDASRYHDTFRNLKSAPPLVFNLKLLEAARKHAAYQLANGQGHDQVEGKTGFTGKTLADRLQATGYIASKEAKDQVENLGTSASNAQRSMAGILFDLGLPLDKDGHAAFIQMRNLVSAQYREIGAGFAVSGGRLFATQVLATSQAARLAGGVIYSDTNRNGVYDPGEGKGGVAISASDGSTASTWASGAYALELKAATEITLTATLTTPTGTLKFTRTFPADPANISFTWVIPQTSDVAAADKLLAEMAKETDAKKPGHFKAAVALYVGTRYFDLDAERAAKAEPAIAEVKDRLDDALTQTREALSDDVADFKKHVAANAKPYQGTAAAALFKEIEAFYGIRRLAGDAQRKTDAKTADAAIKQMEKAKAGLTDRSLKAQIDAYIEQIQMVNRK